MYLPNIVVECCDKTEQLKKRRHLLLGSGRCYETNIQATREEPLKTAFYVTSDQNLYNYNRRNPRIEINSGVEVDKTARAFTASIASVYRLSMNKLTLSDLNNNIPGLDSLLGYKKKMRKFWQKRRM
jgi:hypothetical protein